MLVFNMAILTRPRSIKSLLILTAAMSLTLAPQSLAQSNQPFPDVGWQLSGNSQTSYSTSQSLPDLSPDAIAADVVAQFDPLTGRMEYTAQDFDPFEQENDLAGSVRLRSASSGISRDGANINGGAYLDITVLYSSASRDPYDAKGLEHAVYMNGQPADVMTYNVQALDCKSDITYVSYDDSYYRGASYGYLGGLYRPFPTYRGARYGRECDRIRYGNWRNLTDRYVGYNGFDNRYDRRRRDRDRNRDRDRDRDRDQGVGGTAEQLIERRNRRDEREAAQQRELDLRMRDQVAVSSRNVVRPDRLGDRRLSQPVLNNTDLRPISSGGLEGVGGTTSTAPSAEPRPTYGTGRGSHRSSIGRRFEEVDRVREVGARAGVPRLGNATPRLGNATPRLSTPRSNAPVIESSRGSSQPETRRSPRTRSETRATRSSNSRTSTTRTASSRAATPATTRPQSRPETRPAPAPAPRVSTPKPPKSNSSSNSNNRSSSNRSSSRSSSSRSSKPSTRSVNRSFESRNKSTPRSRRYYSGYTDRYETTRCVKEERITLHIPAERLAAARFDGLSVALLDQHGNDIPLFIPPNYIEGFSKANPYLNHYSSGIPQSVPPTYSYKQPVPQPEPLPGYSGYPTNPVQ